MRVLLSFLVLIVAGVAVQGQQAAPAVRKNSADANQFLSPQDKESLRIRAGHGLGQESASDPAAVDVQDLRADLAGVPQGLS